MPTRKPTRDEQQSETAEQGITWAVEQLQNGERVQRAGWDEKGWLHYQTGSHSITLTTIGGDVFWMPSPDDLLATDWQSVEE